MCLFLVLPFSLSAHCCCFYPSSFHTHAISLLSFLIRVDAQFSSNKNLQGIK